MSTVATIAVALFATLIALGQWWTARQKLVLDLFEKRFQVYMDLRSVASEILQHGQVRERGRINEVIARAQFLFDEDINERLRKIYSLIGEVEMKQPGATGKVNEAFDEIRPFFMPYLAMKQKLPTWSI
jgi:hypothetical protein